VPLDSVGYHHARDGSYSAHERAQIGVHVGVLSAAEAGEVASYLQTGDSDMMFLEWQGQSVLAKCIRGGEAL
jgi:hypothetical protein